jgi:hypothetical protein
MLLGPPLQLNDVDKLVVLKRLDQFNQWCSLDDERTCQRCGRRLTGRDLVVVGGTRGCGPLRVICPTRLCNSIPLDWIRSRKIESTIDSGLDEIAEPCAA